MDNDTAWLFLDRLGIGRDVFFVLGVILASITSWLGKGYLGRKQVRELQEQINQLMHQPQTSIQQTFINGIPLDRQQTVYNDAEGRMFFGTKYGDMAVRFHNAETIKNDIDTWLLNNGLTAFVSPDAVKTILLDKKSYSTHTEERR